MPASLPPGPQMPPLLQILNWGFRPIPFIEACRKKFGHTFTLRFPNYPPFVMITDPAAIREIFTGNPDHLFAGVANSLLKPLVGANSLLLLDGDRHLRERQMMMPAFHGERMQVYGRIMQEVTLRVIESWKTGAPFSIHPEMQKITLDVILRTVFGFSESPELFRLRTLLTRLLNMASQPLMLLLVTGGGRVVLSEEQSRLGRFSLWGHWQHLLRQADEILFEEFARRRRDGLASREDVLSRVMESQDQSGRRLSDRELRDEMITLLVAGHETSTTSLAWLFYHVLSHPEVHARIVEEIRSVTDGNAVRPAHAARLAYLDAVVKETLRLTPIIPLVGRGLQVPMNIGGHEYPAGVVVTPCIYLTHRRQDLWPNPMEFKPERFLDKHASPFEYFPFGGGVRRCLGMAFATYEIKVVAAEVFSRYRLRLAPGYRARVVRRSITFAPSKGTRVIVDGPLQ